MGSLTWPVFLAFLEVDSMAAEQVVWIGAGYPTRRIALALGSNFIVAREGVSRGLREEAGPAGLRDAEESHLTFGQSSSP